MISFTITKKFDLGKEEELQTRGQCLIIILRSANLKDKKFFVFSSSSMRDGLCLALVLSNLSEERSRRVQFEKRSNILSAEMTLLSS
jgi:hypothetical protein